MAIQLTNANVTDKNSLLSAVSFMFNQSTVEDDNLIPCRVIGVKRAAGTVDLQPMIMLVKMDNSTLSRQYLNDINILSLGAGGFVVNFPVKEGDIGWLFAGDRDISLFKQSLTDSAPNSGRMHQFADGIFIPDAVRKFSIAEEDNDAMVIQNTSGTVKLSIQDDNIIIAAPTKVLVRTALAEFSQNILVNGNLTVAGLTSVNGGFTAEVGSADICALPATTTINGINVAGHGHEQDGTSGRTAGGMEA
jgi:hypothetical protein